jgi:hypothetical protein
MLEVESHLSENSSCEYTSFSSRAPETVLIYVKALIRNKGFAGVTVLKLIFHVFYSKCEG